MDNKEREILDSLKPLISEYKVRGLFVAAMPMMIGPAACQGVNLGQNTYKSIFVNENLCAADLDAAKFTAKHEFGHIIHNHLLKTPLFLLICSITISIILPRSVSLAKSYLITRRIQSNDLFQKVNKIRIDLTKHSLYQKFVASKYAGVTLAVIFMIFLKMVYNTSQEVQADDFAIKHSSEEEIRGGIRVNTAFLEIENALKEESFILRWTTATPLHPTTISRCVKLKSAFQKKTSCIYSETLEDRIKIDTIKNHAILKLRKDGHLLNYN